MNKFEKLIEYIINDENDKARELFHNIVVEKSRDIYESIMDEESMEEMVHGGQVQDLTNELADEEAMGEGDNDTFDLDAGNDEGGAEGDFPADGEHGEESEHEDIEDKVATIDAKVDELLAKFDSILGGDDELNAGDVEPDQGGDFGGEPAEVGDEESAIAEASGSGNPFAKGSGKSGSAQSGKSGSGTGSAKMEAVGSGASGKSGSAQSGASGKSGSGKMEGRKSTAELMREYVDKIQDMNLTGATEGDAVGAAGKKSPINAKSIEGPGADFGGTNENIVNGKGNEEAADGKPTPKPSNEYTKGQGEIKSGNMNVPGGNAGKSAFKTKEGEYSTEHGKEGQTTSGSVPVAKKSVQVQNTGRK